MIKKYTSFILGICLMMVSIIFWTENIEAAEQKEVLPIEREADFLAEIHRHLLNRDETFTVIVGENIGILYGDDSEYLFEEVFELEETTSDDFDYLRYHVKTSELKMKKGDKTAYYQFTVSYHDSLAKAEAVNKATKKTLKNLKLTGNPDAVKVIKIHDYIIKQSELYLGQDKFSAYDALKKSASSRGYALLTYKMMREAGIPCRIVIGKMGSAVHVWNIVKLDGVWYYLDNAGDDANSSSLVPVRYTYFLVGTKTLQKNHVLAEYYQTVDFESQYPISTLDYANRGKLILSADAGRTKKKSDVGLFNEAYDSISNIIVDPIEQVNDKISNILLDGLSGVFGGA